MTAAWLPSGPSWTVTNASLVLYGAVAAEPGTVARPPPTRAAASATVAVRRKRRLGTYFHSRPSAAFLHRNTPVECDEIRCFAGIFAGFRRTQPDVLAAAAGAAAGLADVAGTGGAHLDAAGHAERCVGCGALLRLDELGRGTHLRRRRLHACLVLGRCVLDRHAATQCLRVEVLLRRSGGCGAVVLCDGLRALLGGEDAELGALLVGQVLDRKPPEDVVHHRLRHANVRVV